MELKDAVNGGDKMGSLKTIDKNTKALALRDILNKIKKLKEKKDKLTRLKVLAGRVEIDNKYSNLSLREVRELIASEKISE